MSECVSKLHSFKVRFLEVMNARYRAFLSFMFSLGMLPMTIVPTLCTSLKINSDTNINTVFGKLVDVIIQIAFYVGAIIIVSGLFSLFMAFKDDNCATRSAVKSYSICY